MKELIKEAVVISKYSQIRSLVTLNIYLFMGCVFTHCNKGINGILMNEWVHILHHVRQHICKKIIQLCTFIQCIYKDSGYKSNNCACQNQTLSPSIPCYVTCESQCMLVTIVNGYPVSLLVPTSAFASPVSVSPLFESIS